MQSIGVVLLHKIVIRIVFDMSCVRMFKCSVSCAEKLSLDLNLNGFDEGRGITLGITKSWMLVE
jgi:hypothetical protein